MGLGAFPASDPQFLGMLGMHGTYEANLAMYNCDVLINIGARFDDRITSPASSPSLSPKSRRFTIDIDSSLDQQERPGRPADHRRCTAGAEGPDRHLEDQAPRTDQKALKAWWGQIAEWRGRNCLAYKQGPDTIKPQYALERLYHHIKDRDHSHHVPKSASIRCGGAVPQVREAQPLDDLGRARHHGLRLAGGDGVQIAHPDALVIDVAGEASDHDEHPGALHGGAVPPAGEDLHPEQPVHGHGAPVAGAAAWRAAIPRATWNRCPTS